MKSAMGGLSGLLSLLACAETPGTLAGTFNVDAAYGEPRTYGATVTYRFN
jgi:hypothetical protein